MFAEAEAPGGARRPGRDKASSAGVSHRGIARFYAARAAAAAAASGAPGALPPAPEPNVRITGWRSAPLPDGALLLAPPRRFGRVDRGYEKQD